MTSLIMKTLIRNFYLLAYADVFNKRQYDMIGTDPSRLNLLCYSYDFMGGAYEEKFRVDFEHEIYSVLCGDFDGSGKTSLVVTCRHDDIFRNYLVTNKNVGKQFEQVKSQICDTRTAPFIVSDLKDASTSLFIDSADGIKLASYRNNKWTFTDNYLALEQGESIDINHTSTLVDLTGDLKADLCVFIKKADSDKKYLKVFEIGLGKVNLIFEFELSSEIIGPVLFGDFTQSGMNSMVYIERDTDGTSHLCLAINKGVRELPEAYKSSRPSLEPMQKDGVIFDKSAEGFIRAPFSELCPNADPVLKVVAPEGDGNAENRSPAGLFATDIDLDGITELFVTVRDRTSTRSTRIIALKYDPEEIRYKVMNDMESYMNIYNVCSFSTVDYCNKGKEDIIINRQVNGAVVVEGYVNEMNKVNMKLSLTTALLQKRLVQYGMAIPGASYLLVYNNGSNIAVSTNFASGPFLNLTSQTTTIGLGDSTFMIDYLHIGIPENRIYKNLYHVSESIIQNFDLVVYVDKKERYKIVAFFNTSEYTYKIVLVLTGVISANFVSLIFLYWRNKRKLKLERANDGTHSLFRAL